ncbi:MAG TPA: 50S ribosomal protein L29 [Planctomycetota bacterium]|jgi:ribosomal protein L29
MGAIPAKSLREKTSQELEDQMRLTKKSLFDGVVRGSTGEAIKPHEKRDGKRLIARIQTLLRERTRRAELEQRIAKLEPAAKDVSAKVAKQLKPVLERASHVQAQLAKNAGERKHKPMPARTRARHLCWETPADRSAVALAEAKRARAALEREDVGQAK